MPHNMYNFLPYTDGLPLPGCFQMGIENALIVSSSHYNCITLGRFNFSLIVLNEDKAVLSRMEAIKILDQDFVVSRLQQSGYMFSEAKLLRSNENIIQTESTTNTKVIFQNNRFTIAQSKVDSTSEALGQEGCCYFISMLYA